ncbi:MAG TPA: exopolyphosphatase [Desulfosarcina sp.]|nr:exopolyphosphatase [Desulfosarcina sp.]
MRVVTRPDFDGVVCAVLLVDALGIDRPVLWVQPSDMQHRRVDIRPGDVIANLPFHPACTLWFDHHYSNRPRTKVDGVFKIAPSAAGIVYEYYRDRLGGKYTELVRQTDRIDSADLTLDEILHPENHPYVLLSMTITHQGPEEVRYWDHLVALLRDPAMTMDAVMNDPMVQQRCLRVVRDNRDYEKALRAHTKLVDHVSITDFRDLASPPNGNRFLVYSLFPQCTVNVKIVHDDDDLASIKVGHSILNRGCRVNVGKMLTAFEGGGHPGAGACRFDREKAPEYLGRIVSILRKNDPV